MLLFRCLILLRQRRSLTSYSLRISSRARFTSKWTFNSEIYVEIGKKRVNAKSIMGMMSLVLSAGSHVTVVAEGQDEDEAVDALEKFLTA